MSLKYIQKDGSVINVSGLTPGGNLEAGAVATRSGTIKTESIPVGSTVTASVTFSEAMPDTDYEIIFHNTSDCTLGRIGGKTVNGFSVTVRNLAASAQPCNIDYYAFKTYTVQHAAQNASDIEDIKSKIPVGASSSNQLVTKQYVDNIDNDLDGRISDIEDVVPSNASITNKLATQEDLENIEIDVDNKISDLSENPVQNKVIKEALDEKQDNIFVGTTSEWNALNSDEKSKYKLVSLTDDDEALGSEIVDAVTNGVMNPVTSNAVYDAIASKAKILTYNIPSAGGSIEINLPDSRVPYILGVCGMNGGVYGIWMGIGYGATSVRHKITKIVSGGSEDSVYAVEPASNGYSVKVTSTYTATTTVVSVITI